MSTSAQVQRDRRAQVDFTREQRRQLEARIAHVARTNPDLVVSFIAERFGVDERIVYEILKREGLTPPKPWWAEESRSRGHR